MTTFTKETLQRAIDKEIGICGFIYRCHVTVGDNLVKVIAECADEHIVYELVFKHTNGYIRHDAL